jgi:two-component system, cell cycle response regulator CpdR
MPPHVSVLNIVHLEHISERKPPCTVSTFEAAATGCVSMARVVLLVDDDPLVRAVAAEMLEDLGCEVVTAAGGRHAIDTLLANDRIEILITDVNMPDMDGFAVAQAATHMRKELKVIILSGRESDGRGFPLVRKPFLLSDLRRTMAQHTGLC